MSEDAASSIPASARSRPGESNGSSRVRVGTRASPAVPRDFEHVPADQRLLEYDDALAPRPARPWTRDSTRRRLLALADAAAIGAGLAVTSLGSPLAPSGYQIVAILGLWVVLNKLLGLYDRDSVVIDNSTINELPRLAQSMMIGVVAIFLVGPTAGLDIRPSAVLGFAAVALVVTAAARSLVRSLVLRWFGPERALIIGSDAVADLIRRKLQTHSRYGTEVIGYVDVNADNDPGDGQAEVLGDLSRINELCRELRIERVIVAFSLFGYEPLLDAIRAGNALGVKVTVVPRLFEVLGNSVVLDDIEGMSVLSLRGGSRTRLALAVKRAMDIAGATVGLMLLSPALALIALAIKLDSRGPVIFSQERIGRGNRRFKIRKFRTMTRDAERLNAEIAHLNQVELPMLKIPEDRDPRLTRVGRFLRRSMLDELPQLWNVLRGDMSFVGPRPLEPQVDAEVIGWHRARLELTPGLTGPWQALGRHAIPFREMLTLDYLYVTNWSLWYDMKLMVRTAHVVLRAGGH